MVEIEDTIAVEVNGENVTMTRERAVDLFVELGSQLYSHVTEKFPKSGVPNQPVVH